MFSAKGLFSDLELTDAVHYSPPLTADDLVARVMAESESDDRLRYRLVYIGVDSRLLRTASGRALDEIASNYNLRRRVGQELR